MPADIATTDHLDYLQRTTLDVAVLAGNTPVSHAPPPLRRVSRVTAIGRGEKAGRSAPGRLVSEDVLIGLYGYKIPVAFVVEGAADGVVVQLGVWSPAERESASASVMDDRQQILGSMLHSLYPSIELVPAAEHEHEGQTSRAGLALGVPTAKPGDPVDGALPLDRLIRALSGVPWTALVLAEPVHESTISDLRNGIINEMRAVQSPMHPAAAPSPLSRSYLELLQGLLKNVTSGGAIGGWRTSVYLLGDTTSYYRLASVWRGVFSGEHSIPEPVRIWDCPIATDLARGWAIPDVEGSPGPGSYRHPFQFQTLLTSAQLAAYIHLPQLETSGFSVVAVPDFDVVRSPIADDAGLQVGQVIHRGRPTPANYAITYNALARHAFVAGVTGAGKTNTIFHLLGQAAARDIPFLVIEPAKTEYRALLRDSALGAKLRIFTLGNENVSPLRLNPLEALPGTPVGVHLDLLRSVFNASFGLWSVLPAVLEQCLHYVYEDRGWDTATNSNARLDEDADLTAAFPTLSELAAKVDAVTQALRYDAESEATIRAALLTRINSLRSGSKGRMLDVQRSFSMSALLEHPTVLELEAIGDDDDKAFLMGLLFIRLVEFRRASGHHDLQHLLVIEEAHRLLSAVETQKRSEEANARGKAVETFANLLSEIRAYGQGVVIADQIPGRLAPDVIKNTNLKVVHRVVAFDDRASLAGAMAMNDRQVQALATLAVGQAAVFSEGDDAPVLVQVPAKKQRPSVSPPDNAEVAGKASGQAPNIDMSLLLPFPSCARTCITRGPACDAARHIVEDQQFQRVFAHSILSTIEDTSALDRVWPNLLSVGTSETSPEAGRAGVEPLSDDSCRPLVRHETRRAGAVDVFRH